MVHLLLVLMVSATLQAQSVNLIVKTEAHADSLVVMPHQIDSLLNRHLDVLWSQGYWNAKMVLESDGMDSQTLIAHLERGSITRIENIHFSGVTSRDEYYLVHELLMGKSTIEVNNLVQAENRIQDKGYLFEGHRSITKDLMGNYHAEYTIRKRPELNMDILAAFNQPSGADTVSWFGHVNLHVPNLDGRGKSIRLNWKRLKTNSEYFSFGYEHPWILNIPLTGQLKYGREVVDGNYQVVVGTIGLAWNVSWERSLIFKYEDNQSLITQEGALQNPEWQSTRRGMFGVGYRQSNLDIINHTGLALLTTFDQELNFEPSSVSRFVLRSEFEYGIYSKLYLSQRSAFVVQNETNAQNDPSLLVPLGGMNSVRGYSENLLRSLSVISLQHDFHLSLGLDSQLLALIDIGAYYEEDSINYLTGYGVGVQLRSSRGPIRLILATHEGVALRNSFLHIEYSRGLSWIDQ